MKKLIIFLLVNIVVVPIFCQDIIKTTSSTEIKAIVLEINDSTVKYKKYDYQDGPTFTIQKSEIISIVYQNGTSDVFQKDEQQTKNASSSSNLPNTSDNISTLTSVISIKKSKKHPDMNCFFIYLGASFPIGQFGKMGSENVITPLWNDVDNYGGAIIGFNLGLKGRIPVFKYFGVTIGGELFYNGIKESAFFEDEEYIRDLSLALNQDYGVNGYDYRLNSRSKYLNIPILLGIDYTYMFGNGLGISAEASCGVDFDFITPTVYRNNLAGTYLCSEYQSYSNTQINYYSAEKLKYLYVPAVHFAYQGNVSFIFGKRWNIGLYYFGATKSNIKFDMKETSSTYKMDNSSGIRIYCQKLGINMIMLKLGVGF